MTVNTVSPAIISRAEFNLNAGQTKTPQLVRMDFTNLVTNGGFDTDTDWTKTSVTISGGQASLSGDSNLTRNVNTGLFLNRSLRVTFDVVTYTSGALKVGTSSGALYLQSVNATGSFGFNAIFDRDNVIFQRQVADFTGVLDNVSIYEADPSDDAPWLRLPYGYSVGRTGMIVRDGVVLHPSDYSEVKDSGQTWIKPIVAPGVSTEFSIWGSPSYAV